MRRSYIALAVVIVVSAVAIFIHLQPSDEDLTPPEQTKTGKVEKAKPKEAPKPPEPKEKVPPLQDDAADPEDPEQGVHTKEGEEVEAPAKAADEVLQAAEQALDAGNPKEAIETLSQAIKATSSADAAEALKKRQRDIVDKHFFSRTPSPLTTTYTVVAGDNLRRIAAAHNTTEDYIARLNNIRNKDLIRVGQKLKIVEGAFDVTIRKSNYLLTVTKDGLWMREIKVGLGKDGATPTGEFVAGPKITRPPYTAVHPPIPFGDKENNPLGTRWITIQGAGSDEYGIHGTWDPDSIGKEKSKGCIRMLNKDVEWLFDLIVPGKSKIVIKP
jgi:lipoprotein-anchoring transpeptidase ErfK/SrfK